MRTFAARVQKLRRIVIPKDVADDLDIRQGDWVEVTVKKLGGNYRRTDTADNVDSVYVPKESVDSSGMFKCPKCGSGMYIYRVSDKCRECGVKFIY